MKFITITSAQYSSERLNWSKIYNCDATDFVFIPPSYSPSLNTYEEQAAAINDLIDHRTKTTKVWIGTPGIDSNNFWRNPSWVDFTNYLEEVYNRINHKSKIAGAYMNQESIYGCVSYSNLIYSSNSGNIQIRRMYDIKNWVKQGYINGTNFLWIPYYGYGTNAASIIKNVGYIADSIQIFDYCIIQPHYFFEPELCPNNLEGVVYSIRDNKIKYRNNVSVISNKESNTKIGFEMEYARYGSVSGDRDKNYQAYIDAFYEYRNNKPAGFYWGGYADSSTFDKINSFFND